ncbi:YdeI/OmpD-associated family protein [Flagellimonas aequoris]|uniref:YdhG-like domain-containing protein n=1 Tax=Flagellimonas aequoris TaxID=2306997 RepID=A0A418N618_9FLAO|nr:YdeI/OmpD-associated family protein [Allomuricauda aequoris]RIV69894.1 hypothetical protein D2U88_12140 [Allomuricauda aequoris]TXK01481.1 hypothetical protein FQ019_12030 [Allomuricauda aequoris]
MEKSEKLEAFYEKEHPFKNGIALLRELALQTDCEEDFKWSFPVYTVNGKNVFGVSKFKGYFGVWFFNGALMNDQKKVLENAQEGKTKGMRHWKFFSLEEVDKKGVIAYMQEAIQNQKKGIELATAKPTKAVIPDLLQTKLAENASLKSAFDAFAPYKQKEFCEYIAEAKQEATKLRRLDKILPMIEKGVGLNDGYR